MTDKGSSQSSSGADDRLVRVPLSQLHAHPSNANLMTEEWLEKLARNIAREGRYPPLIVRPHPELQGEYQLLDGHQRDEVLRRLGHSDALCYVWDCDDATALTLLASLNRLAGEDVPARRAALLAELTGIMSVEELALLLPEDAGAIRETLELLDLDSDALLAELTAAAERQTADAPRLVSFAVLPEDEPIIEEAIGNASRNLGGPNRRGRALGIICKAFLEGIDG